MRSTDVDKALKLDPDQAAANELRGMILLGLDKYDEALKSFDRSSELVPEAPLPYQHRGRAVSPKGRSGKSARATHESAGATARQRDYAHGAGRRLLRNEGNG